jgi:hypothetical protein
MNVITKTLDPQSYVNSVDSNVVMGSRGKTAKCQPFEVHRANIKSGVNFDVCSYLFHCGRRAVLVGLNTRGQLFGVDSFLSAFWFGWVGDTMACPDMSLLLENVSCDVLMQKFWLVSVSFARELIFCREIAQKLENQKTYI